MSARDERRPAAPPEARLPVAGTRQSWREVFRLLRNRRGRLAATVLLLLAGSATALLVPPLLGRIVDAVIAGAGIEPVAGYAALIVAAGVCSALLLRWGGRLLVACLQGALAELREEVFASAIRLEQHTVENAGSSDVVSRVTTDVEAITGAVSEVLPRFVQAGFTIALTALGLTLLDPWLALAALAAVPVQLATTVLFLRSSRPLYRRLRREEADRGQTIIETVHGSETIIAHRAHDERLDRIASRSIRAVDTERQTARVRNRFTAGLNLAEFIGLAAILIVGYLQAVNAGLSVGSVTAAALFFHQLFGPIGALLASLDDLQRATAGLARLVGVAQAAAPEASRREIEDGSLSLRGVGYRYPGHRSDALRDVTLEIPADTTTVLVGVSGSGKSTLAQLIAGVFAPSHGEVLVGGVPATDAVHHGHRAVLLVTQDTHLFGGSLADNLRLARPQATEAELWSALEGVGADWARAGSDGLDTVWGDDLDDARIQQLALARVLLANPPVVVLDEATAHAGTGSTLDQAMQAVIRGRTAIIVAHRLRVAEHADRIVVFDDARIREQGTPAELAGTPHSAYARLLRAAGLSPRQDVGSDEVAGV